MYCGTQTQTIKHTGASIITIRCHPRYLIVIKEFTQVYLFVYNHFAEFRPKKVKCVKTSIMFSYTCCQTFSIILWILEPFLGLGAEHLLVEVVYNIPDRLVEHYYLLKISTLYSSIAHDSVL